VTGTQLNAVAASDDGHVYVTGTRGSYTGPMLVRAYGPGGALRWTRSWRPKGTYTRGVDVAVGPDGTVYVLGAVAPEGFEGQSWFLRAYSPDGRLLWRRAAPDWRENPYPARFASGVAAGSGLVVLSGYDHGCCGDSYWHDGWVRAYDTSGDLRWVIDFESPGLRRTLDAANDVAIGALGRIYVAGWIAMGRETETTRADHEVMIQKLAPSGDVLWTRILRDRGKEDRDEAHAVAVRGNLLMVAGLAGDPEAYDDAWLARFTVGGQIVWERSWFRGERYSWPRDIAIGASGATYVVGEVRDLGDRGTDLFLRRYEPRGRLGWQLLLEEDLRHLTGTGVDGAAADTLFVTGYGSDERWGDPPYTGYLWRFDPSA